MTLRDHLKLFLADALVQLAGYRHEGLIYGLLQLDTRQRHILRERRRMTGHLWYKVMFRYGWTCAKCKACNYQNRSTWKPKMQVDHVKSLFSGGRTEWSNLQILCGPCNQAKGVKTADYR